MIGEPGVNALSLTSNVVGFAPGGSADILAYEEAAPAAVLNRARADAARIPLQTGDPAPEGKGLVVVLRF